MKKPKSEQEMRIAVLTLAKKLGCDYDVRQIFNRYDNLLKNCKDETERKQIGTMGLAEIHKLFDCSGALIVNGEIIIPADPNYKEEPEA